MRSFMLVGLSAFILPACAPTVYSTRLIDASPGPAGQEILLYSSKLPSCPYEEVGLVSGEGDIWFNSDGGVLKALKEQARRMGGDAIVGLTQQRPSKGKTPTLSGTVVRFTNSECGK